MRTHAPLAVAGLLLVACTTSEPPPTVQTAARPAPAAAASAAPTPAPVPTPPPDLFDPLSQEERVRLLEITQDIVIYGAYPYGFNNRDLWVVLDKLGPLTSEQLEQVKQRLGGPITRLERTFWEDALASMEQRQPVQSDQRRQLEAGMVQLGLLSDDVVALRAERMTLIARHEPISLPGMTVVLDPEAVARVIGFIDEAAQTRMDALFEREPAGDPAMEEKIRRYGLDDAVCAKLAREYRADEKRRRDLVHSRERSRTEAERGAIEKELEELARKQQVRIMTWKKRVDAYRTSTYAASTRS